MIVLGTSVLASLIIGMLTLTFTSHHAASAFAMTTRKAKQLTTPLRRLERGYHRSTITMMPEGPEVKTLVDQLQPAVGMRLVDFRFLSGRYVRHGRPAGFEEFAKTMTPVGGERRHLTEGSNNGGDNNGSNELTYTGYEDDENDKHASVQVDIVTSIKCKGKFIYLTLDHGQNKSNAAISNHYQRSIWITLGMTGQFLNQVQANKLPDGKSDPRWYIELMDTTTRQTRRIYYRDTRNFGTLKFILSAQELMDKLDTLGPDVLDNKCTEDVFLDILDRSSQKRNICKLLMDQTKLSGVG